MFAAVTRSLGAGSLVSLLACAGLAGCAERAPLSTAIIAPGASFSEVSRVGLAFAEGVTAAPDGSVYLSDITDSLGSGNPGGTIYRYDPSSGSISKYLEPSGMSNGLHADANGNLLIAQGDNGGARAIARRNLATGTTQILAERYHGQRFIAPNDVTSDAHGHVYFTDALYGPPSEPITLPNAVYRIDPGGAIVQLSTDLRRPNGIEVSPNGRRLYVAAFNTAGLPPNPNGPAADRFGLSFGGVVVYDLSADGTIANGRVFYRNDDLGVDGMAMDTAGDVYLALHNGNFSQPKGAVIVLSPEGVQLMNIPLPGILAPSNLGFGRGSDAHTLYMTSPFPWRLFRIPTMRVGFS